MQKLEYDFLASGGEFKVVKAKDIFTVKSNPQLNKESFKFTESGEYPYFTRTVLNNGIAGYVEYLNEENKVRGNCLAIGMLGMKFFYMDKDFYAGQFTKTIYPNFSGFNAKNAQYFITLLNKYQKVYQGRLIRDFEDMFEQSDLILPYKFEKLDLDYIEQFITELQTERLQELKAEQLQVLQDYLKVTGLSNYTLTDNEKKALEDFQNGEIEYKEFILGDLFDVGSWVYGKNKKYNSILRERDEYSVEVISSVTENNGVNYYTNDELNEDEIFEKELTISTRGEYSGTVFYHDSKFVLANNILVMKMPNLTRNQKVFIGSLINKLPYGGYSGYPKKDTLKKDSISLVIENNLIDFEFMDNFISAVQKLVIKDVVDYSMREITLIEHIINQTS